MAPSHSKLIVTTATTKQGEGETPPARVTPNKAKAYATIRRSGTKKSYHNKETVTVEAVADGSLVLVKVSKKINGAVIAGYLKEVHDVILNDGHDVADVLGESNLNVRYGKYIYVCKDHETDEPVFQGFVGKDGKRYKMCVIPAVPNMEIYGDEKGNLNLQKVRNTFVKWLAMKGNNNPANVFTAWDLCHDETRTPPRSLDQCVVDASAGDILLNYYLPDGIDHGAVYGFLNDNNMSGFYSTKLTTNEYSEFAKSVFSFP